MKRALIYRDTPLWGLVLGIMVALLAILWPAYNDDSERCCCERQATPRPVCTLAAQFSDEDLQRARVAWKYFENNYQPTTGLVNASNDYPSTTMWDTGSAIFATVTARELCLIDDKDFNDRMTTLLGTLNSMPLYDNVAPNKAYNTITGRMVDYNNQDAAQGIGVSIIDLARLIASLRTLSSRFPQMRPMAEQVIGRWNYCDLLKNGQMYGLYHDSVMDEMHIFQEGRLGYEQYAGKIFQRLGFDMYVSSTYNNEFRADTIIDGVSIAYDKRDPRQFGAYNYVVSESYILEQMESGADAELKPLFDHVYDVQEARSAKVGRVIAVSEDHIDREPWFLYNTIFVAGSPWQTITDTGVDHHALSTISTKAAMLMAQLYPDRPYSQKLDQSVAFAYDEDQGWYSGVYDAGLGYNKALTENTNGIILEGLLHKALGSFNALPEAKAFQFPLALTQSNREQQCIPPTAETQGKAAKVDHAANG